MWGNGRSQAEWQWGEYIKYIYEIPQELIKIYYLKTQYWCSSAGPDGQINEMTSETDLHTLAKQRNASIYSVPAYETYQTSEKSKT